VLASEFVTTSITSKGMSDSLLAAVRASNPDILYARADERGYTLVDFSPKRCLAEFRTTANPAGTNDILKVQARFAIESNHPGPQPA
jgi:alkaline phosphatase D